PCGNAKPKGYTFSPGYDATCSDPELPINAPAGTPPYGIVADDNWAPIMAEPGVYVRRRVPPVFGSIRREGQMVILEWRGQGILQSSGDASGPWDDIPSATSPHPDMIDAVKRFYRVIAR